MSAGAATAGVSPAHRCEERGERTHPRRVKRNKERDGGEGDAPVHGRAAEGVERPGLLLAEGTRALGACSGEVNAHALALDARGLQRPVEALQVAAPAGAAGSFGSVSRG